MGVTLPLLCKRKVKKIFVFEKQRQRKYLFLKNKGNENICFWKTKIKKIFVFGNKGKQRKVQKKRKVVFYGKMYSGTKSAM